MIYQSHKFFCIKCGNPGIPVQRPSNKQREKFHRKKLYCIHCKEFTNHIEVKDWEQEQEFRQRFENGEYEEEANSVDNGGSSWKW